MFHSVKSFQVGQKVQLQTAEHGDQVRISPADSGEKVVVSVAEDHIILEDEIAGVRMRIPVHYIRYSPAEAA
jgi:hypothetical protein